MRPEILYLTDIVEASDAIARFLLEVPLLREKIATILKEMK